MHYDLVVLAADKDQEFAIRGLLSSPGKLGIRPINFQLLTHPYHDPGCLQSSHEILRPYHRLAHHALVVLDVEGSGHRSSDPSDLETEIEQKLAANGWEQRASSVAIAPEVEAWVWSSSPHVERVLGWSNDRTTLREWLQSRNAWSSTSAKPEDPKAALLSTLEQTRKPRSSSLFQKLATLVSYSSCNDRSFQRLLSILRAWFVL